LQELSDERKLEIGDSWNRIQVDYGNLLRKTKISVEEPVEERQGMALWKGKWVPNFKRFKKVFMLILFDFCVSGLIYQPLDLLANLTVRVT